MATVRCFHCNTFNPKYAESCKTCGNFLSATAAEKYNQTKGIELEVEQTVKSKEPLTKNGYCCYCHCYFWLWAILVPIGWSTLLLLFILASTGVHSPTTIDIVIWFVAAVSCCCIAQGFGICGIIRDRKVEHEMDASDYWDQWIKVIAYVWCCPVAVIYGICAICSQRD